MDPNDERNVTTTHVLIPKQSKLLRNVVLWSDYYFRWSPMLSNMCPPECMHKYLYPGGKSNPAGTDISTDRNNVIDLHLPPLQSQEDMWEATYRAELVSNSHHQTGSVSGGAGFQHRSNIADILKGKDETIERQQVSTTFILSTSFSTQAYYVLYLLTNSFCYVIYYL